MCNHPRIMATQMETNHLALIVYDFSIQYTGTTHAQHLLMALANDYTVTTDWEGKKFTGIDLAWDYHKQTCRLTMDCYIDEVRP